MFSVDREDFGTCRITEEEDAIEFYDIDISAALILLSFIISLVNSQILKQIYKHLE